MYKQGYLMFIHGDWQWSLGGHNVIFYGCWIALQLILFRKWKYQRYTKYIICMKRSLILIYENIVFMKDTYFIVQNILKKTKIYHIEISIYSFIRQ